MQNLNIYTLKDKLELKDVTNFLSNLSDLRFEWKESKIKKSGKNNFLKFNYFELDDIVPFVINNLPQFGFVDIFRFTKEEATLTLIDVLTNTYMVFTMPIDIKKDGDPMQAIGAAQTYARRYLYMQLLNIVEPDFLDSDKQSTAKVEAKAEKVKKVTVDKGESEKLTQTAVLRSLYAKAKKLEVDNTLLTKIQTEMTKNPEIKIINQLIEEVEIAINTKEIKEVINRANS